MGSVTVSILVNIIFGNGLAPNGSTLEFDVVSVNTSVNDISDNTVATPRIVKVLLESGEAKPISVGDTGETPGGAEFSGNARGGNVDLLDLLVRRVVIDAAGNLESGHDLVLLDIGHLGSSSDGVKGARGKLAGCCRTGQWVGGK